MALEDYRRKRDFGKTPEPAGSTHGKRAAKGELSFVVQKHAARRLHYDCRLELGGVMKSWAVPKGPSLDPREKRLAVHVEDHPMEYNEFEGVIPEGQYGGGTVLLWDRGTWEPLDPDPEDAYRKGNLKFTLHGKKLRGKWALVRMGGRAAQEKRENWLLIKEKDEYAVPGSGSRLVDDNPLSVVSGRDLPAIAADRDRVWHSDRDLAEAEEKPAAKPRRRSTRPPIAGARKAALPEKLSPQLASLVAAAPSGRDWLHEIKFDGYRILARIEKGEVRLDSRNGLDWTAKFPRLARRLAALPVATALVDGEAVALDEKGASNFGALQQALSDGRTDDVVYYAFDLVHLDGWDLAECALADRKAALQDLLADGRDGILRYSDHQEGEGPEIHRNACAMALEGIVSKRRDAPYRPGRQRLWVKVKCENRDEFVIIGWTEPGGSRLGFGALVLGYYGEKGKLHYGGRVGTGFDDKFLLDFHSRLKQLKEAKKPFAKLPAGAARGVHWVEPRYVAEIQYSGITRDGLLRHPAFLGLREDKAPEEAVLPRPGKPPTESEAREPEPVAPGTAKKATAKKAAAAKAGKNDTVEVAGVRLSHAGKVLYSDSGITKLDLARYYEAVADHALRHLGHRPLTLVRCPDGAEGQCFFQKHVGAGLPPTIGTVPIPENDGGTSDYLVIETLPGLVALVQMGALELHPWGSTVDDLEHPDQLIFDLDPDVGLDWERIVEAALALRGLLDGLGLASFAKTTGGKGLHVVVPIEPAADWDEAKAFTKAVADAFATAQPDRYTAVMAKKARKGRLFIDYLRNGRGATAVGAFSTRARKGATVATPVSWEEVEGGVRSDAFTIRTVPDRLKRLRRDPWADFAKARRPLTGAIKAFEGKAG